MSLVMMVSRDSATLENLAKRLGERTKLELIHVDSAKKALTIIEKAKVDVLVAGEELADGDPLSLVNEVTRKQPMTNCAMVSSLSPKKFHAYTEGLGVFMQLPLQPGAEEAERMLEILDSIDALLRV
ncbi:MAG: hypothetical protein KQH63_10480 [Desulfobulbaceae bacterium]|nr:hypothetical protein [Desulfobulbaceae bacterium]